KGLYEDLSACQGALNRIFRKFLPEASQEAVKAVEGTSEHGTDPSLVLKLNELDMCVKLGRAIDILAQILYGEGNIQRSEFRKTGEVYLDSLFRNLESLANDTKISDVGKSSPYDSTDRSLGGLFSKHQAELQRLKESPTDEALKLPPKP
ncbi:MAG: hypothetical protein ACK5Y6_09395, partial [Pseudomonadota bacterium]